MLPEWKVVGYLHHPFLRHSEERSDAGIRFPRLKGRIVTPVCELARNDRGGESLKIANGSPCHPGCDTAVGQSIHMDLGVRMDGYGPPPPFILTSRGKLQEYASWSTFTDHEAYLFVIGRIGLKHKLFGFS